MQTGNLDIFACPECRCPLEVTAEPHNGTQLERGWLCCPRCQVASPVLHGFPCFVQQALGTPLPEVGAAEALEQELFGPRAEYERFLQRKRRRPAIDAYAAFRPFNESTRSLLPFVPLLRERLRPGDVILDLWCRTGWTGDLLAHLFPEQHVICVWEGDHDVLGTSGFGYWLGSGLRASNLEIVFTDPNGPLPFAKARFAVVHGLDSLHRYRHRPFVSECLRVARGDGILLFPHIHLTNNEPDPYFDRGETQLHGTVYREFFEQRLKGSGRRAFLLSEKDLFVVPEGLSLADDSSMEHYNACLAVVPESLAGHKLELEAPKISAHDYVLINPLLDVDLSRSQVKIDPSRMHGQAGHLFDRHPMYLERLRQQFPRQLTVEQCKILYWAKRLRNVLAIAAQVGLPVEDVKQQLAALAATELVHVRSMSQGMVQLQNYYSDQFVTPLPGEETLPALWKKAVLAAPDRPYLHFPEDGSNLSYGECDEIIQHVCSFFTAQNLQPGDQVLLHAALHPEFYFAFWAAQKLGLVVAVVDPKIGSERWQAVLPKLRLKLALLADSSRCEQLPCATFRYAGAGQTGGFPEFLDAVTESTAIPDFPVIKGTDSAVIQLTSGSTGMPKCVLLNHAQLVHSSDAVDRAFEWHTTDRFLSTGAQHTASGLRNGCLAPLHSGAAVVLASAQTLSGPLELLGTCVDQEVTILNTTPAFLSYCVQLSGKATFYANHKLRMVICTGARLSNDLRQVFEARFGCPVLNYYGLTETAGATIFVDRETAQLKDAGIGLPLGCFVRVLDAGGRELSAGESGQLALYTGNLHSGYLDGDELLPNPQLKDGFLHTGDQVHWTADGVLEIEGRKDRLLIDRNGENVSPDEIENALNTQVEVLDSFALTIADENGDSQIVALVVAFDEQWLTRGELQQIRSRLAPALPPAHIPKVLIPIDRVPSSASGKWDPVACRRIALEYLAEQQPRQGLTTR